jgi:hypothetical protein
MAGVKITDLTPLATAVSGDLLYIVDISDTTESPQGTSKQIEVGNLLDFESGTWTPTFSDFNGALTAATLTSASYLRIGNVVTCQINLFIDIDFSTLTSGDFKFTYPIATTTANGGGSLSSSSITKQFNGSIRNNNISMQSEDTSLVSSTTCHAIFQYEIN